MSKIIEMILEPSKIYVGSSFLLKIKAIKHMTYREMKEQKVSKIKEYKTKDLKGEGI